MDIAVAVWMIGMGLAIAGIWTRDILAGDQVDVSDGVFRAREEPTGTLFWPHWLAEYTTAILLVVGGIGLLADASWAVVLAAAALGTLFYTSTNSLGWAFAARERVGYAVPMLAGVILSSLGTVYLLLR